MTETLQWKVHTTQLFEEVLRTPGTEILQRPLQITLMILQLVAKRAIELDDPELHRLMVRLTLYAQADPTSPDYDPEMIKRLEAA